MTSLSRHHAIDHVKAAIIEIAPELEHELRTLDPTIDLWDSLDLDSMDHQNIMVEIFNRTGVEIAERDYPLLRSLDGLADHVAATAA